MESHIGVVRRPRKRRPVRLLILQVELQVGDVGEGLEIARSLSGIVEVHSVVQLLLFLLQTVQTVQTVLLCLHRRGLCSHSQRIPLIPTAERPFLPLSPSTFACLSPGSFSVPCHHLSVHLRGLALLAQTLHKQWHALLPTPDPELVTT